MSLIKQEHMHPPPRAITPLPPATHQITLEEYKEREKKDYYRDATKDASVKKVVLSLLKDHPGMWQNGNRFQPEKWRALGVDVYQRTGQIVRVNDMRKMLVMGKSVLKKKIAICIRDKKLDRAATEKDLWYWEYYRHFLYYRETLGQFEANLRGEEWTGEDQIQDEDDIIYDGMLDGDLSNSSHNFAGHGADDDYQVEEVQYSEAGFRRPESVRGGDSYFGHGPPPQMVMGSSASNFSSATQSHSRNRKSSSIDHTEVDRSAQHIAEQAKRLFLQYPEKSNLIRETMFKTILAFDDPSADYQNVGEIFDDLAAQEAAKKRKRAENRAQREQQ
ncbi:LIn-8 Domain containing [Caenorhabditis elegans]|uniref:LIn-8 Domain containing n=1 Tax=Caenorhabditis elegans TaxID=6239 RepID=O17151_CAEEL|nr:LIn-8 Domain containing [Caenorhabditis elegans]CCD61998.1 LIn-8 Domain containing [Caenorhabditis elegans]|eukprot:NP_494422.1 LIn-8 Domain containing [Caenorhabditis elegans]